MSFAHPWLLIASTAAPVFVVGLYFYDRMRRGQLTRRLGELPVIGRVMASASPGRRLLKTIVMSLGLLLLGVAAARPMIEGKRKVELRGLDLVVALDVSKSMMVDDVGKTQAMLDKSIEPTRLARARELAVAVIDELPGDRIAPVVFAGAASHFPLTEDHEVAARFLYDLGPADLPPGSNLAEVFRVSRCLLRPDLYEDLGCARMGRRGHGGDPLHGESLDPKGKQTEKDAEAVLEQKQERGKAIVLVTDGGEPDAETIREVATARELGIAVFILGVGSTKGGVVYEIDALTGKRTRPKQGPNGESIISKREDAGMKSLATAAGDEKRYFVSSESGEIDPMPLVEALRVVNRGLATKQVKEQRDVYQGVLFAALMLLVIEAAIGTRRRQRYPEAS
ncbi:MAG: VWA domain-containing protein [Deltaproteobacteria bacterium]|nr:VWA domain-containing protein [Deltaproteobacteria bacterium]